MKQRDIYRVPARLENRPGIGWVMVVTIGTIDHAFVYGDDKPRMAEPMVNLVLEYTIPEAN